jgi:hypothetical protein
MSVKIEVIYGKPSNCEREREIAACASRFGGVVTFREDDTADSICLTIEFADREAAERAISKIRDSGEHVEGPADYGD